jgi:hypothetical protein
LRRYIKVLVLVCDGTIEEDILRQGLTRVHFFSST